MKTVCVIGNSADVLGSGLGPEVDKCDIVIRCNDFVIGDYKNDVGTKTTIACTNFSPANKVWNKKDFPTSPTRDIAEKCEIWAVRPYDISLDPHLPYRVERCISWLGHANIVYPTVEQWNRALRNSYVGFWRPQPSTGLIAIEMAIDHFKDCKIYLHGFDFNPVEKTHYFDLEFIERPDPSLPHDGIGHDWPGEVAYIKRLISSKSLAILGSQNNENSP